MEETLGSQKVKPSTEEEAVGQPEPVSLSTEQPKVVPGQTVVSSEQGSSPPKKAPMSGNSPGFFKKYGLVLIIIDVVLVLGLAVMGVAYWKMTQERTVSGPTPTPILTPAPAEEEDAQTSALEQQGSSDEVEEIEADLDATDLSEIDKELEDIEAELAAP